MPLTKSDKAYVMQNLELSIEELANDLGTKVNKALKNFLAVCQAQKAAEKPKIQPNAPTVFLPPAKAEEDAFHQVMPPPTDGIIRYTPKR